MKKRGLLIVSIIILLAIVIAGGFGLSCYLDSRNNAYTIDVSMGPTEKTLVEENTISYALINNSYTPVQVREIVVLSVYDENEVPVPAGGSAYVPSKAGISELETAGRKAVQDHQVIYVTEYAVEEGKVLFENYFQTRKEPENIHTGIYTLRQDADCSIQVDVFLQGKCRKEDSWQTLCSSTDKTGSDAAVTPLTGIPVLTDSVSYQWRVEGNAAFLNGLGTLLEREILIPAQVQLSKTENGYVHDPIDGTVYPVVVGDSSLSNTDVREVTFEDGVKIANNTMGTFEKGFFENCKELTAVNNIPNTVTDMVGTFKGCTALQQTPEIPDSVTKMQYVFKNCTALTAVSTIPNSVMVMDGCFEGCTALQKMPELPNEVVSVKYLFKDCTALTDTAALPESITDMEGAFVGCTALTKTPVLPDIVINMKQCFSGCSALTEVNNIPASVENMTSCFANCASLQSLPDFPDQPAEYYGCFIGCTALTGKVEIPAGIMNHERYYMNLKNIFDGCGNIDEIVVQSCKNQDIIAVLPETVRITFAMEHVEKGVCPTCHYVTDTYVVNGLDVYMEHIAEDLVQQILAYLNNEVPDSLKDTCTRLTYTNDFEKYYDNQSAQGFAEGVAFWDSRQVYVRVDSCSKWARLRRQLLWSSKGPVDQVEKYEEGLVEQIIGTTVHEMAHCYDSYHSISSAAQWQQLCEEEASGEMKALTLGAYSSEDGPREVFAMLTASYIMKENAAFGGLGLKDYIENLFDEAA